MAFLFVFLTNSLGSSIIVGEALDEDNARAEAASREINLGLEEKISQLDMLCADWGIWDEAWYFVQYHNSTFAEQVLYPDSLLACDLDVLLFYNVTGDLVDGLALDKDNGTVIEVPADLLSIIGNDTTLNSKTDIEDHRLGILSLVNGSAMFSSRPVIKTSMIGPAMGSIIMVSLCGQWHGILTVGAVWGKALRRFGYP